MFKVLIVDNEPFVREGLKTFIDWEKYGFTVCGEAENGEEALKLVEMLSPHLIMTDIRMPVIDGLELVRRLVCDMKSTAKFIIISGYGEFKYAQTAIRYNVRNYILKPVDEDELVEALNQVHSEIEKELEHEMGHAKIVKALASDTIKNLITGEIDEEVLMYATRWLNISGEKHLRYSLMEAIENNNIKEIESIVKNIFAKFESEMLAPEIIKAYIINFKLDVIKLVSEMNGDGDEFIKQVNIVKLDRMEVNELKEILIRFCADSTQYIKVLKDKQVGGVVYEVEKYIRNNYTHDINLKSMAEKFYINAVYLGQLFKKSFGMYFNDYLHNLRIEEAKKLLRRTDLKVYEVSDKVGYNNPDYFVSKFEKLTHITPAQYKKMHSE